MLSTDDFLFVLQTEQERHTNLGYEPRHLIPVEWVCDLRVDIDSHSVLFVLEDLCFLCIPLPVQNK